MAAPDKPTQPTLRERQAPLKERYSSDPASARLTITVHSTTQGNEPTRAEISTTTADATAWAVGAHPYAGGDGELACSGDLLLASLAACQEITVRMVAAAMGIALTRLEVTVDGDLDFRGTMGIDAETPVGFSTIRTNVRLEADAPADRLERLARRAEQYCVVASTLRQPPSLMTTIDTGAAG